ncbi:MAG: tetratricopeptide repeat protein [Lachnospiraceae bacterium]
MKAEEIKALISRREFRKAVKIADEIDWTRVRSVAMLCTVSDLYKVNRRYKESKELLLMAYERHPGGRMILYSLCELCIKMGEVVQAIEYYKEFVQLAPMDNGKYVLQYKLYEAQEVSLEERIAVLEELKKRDYREKWGYELAYLYHRIGLTTKCVEECDQLILWFSEGRYVKKAMELKMLHEPLSPAQQVSYEHLMGGKKATDAPQQESVTGKVKEEVPKEQAEELEIQVQPMKMGQYDTINLQKALAESMKEVLSPGEPKTEEAEKPDTSESGPGTVTSQIMAPMYDTPSTIKEVFFEDNTAEIAGELKPEVLTSPLKEEAADAPKKESEAEAPAEEGQPSGRKEKITLQRENDFPPGEATKEIPSIKEIMKRPLVEPLTEDVPAPMAGFLSQDYDGQISLVVPEETRLEKQITGQMKIEDVLIEWEKTKKENEEKRKAELTQKVMAQTGSMFSEFEAKVRDGILEQLEKEEELADSSKQICAEQQSIVEEQRLAQGQNLSGEQYQEQNQMPPGETFLAEEQAAALEQLEEEAGEEELKLSAAEKLAEVEELPEVEELEEIEEEPAVQTSQEDTLSEKQIKSVEEPSEEEEQDTVRDLTDEERTLFGPFIQTKGARKRFMRALDMISLAAYTGNVIVSGEAASGTVKLAKNIMKDIQMTDANFSGVVAKVSGASLNSKNVDSTISKLNNGGLIIEKASGMNSQAVMKLLKALNQEQTGIVVILEDNKKAIKRMLAAYPAMETFFNARIEIEELNNDALAAYGRQYAYHLEYSIDELGMLALQTRIEDRQTSDHIVTVAEVRELVDEAIAHADKKNLAHLFDLLLGKRYDEEDMVILREKDFM